jgi:hypothetical protein
VSYALAPEKAMVTHATAVRIFIIAVQLSELTSCNVKHYDARKVSTDYDVLVRYLVLVWLNKNPENPEQTINVDEEQTCGVLTDISCVCDCPACLSD